MAAAMFAPPAWAGYADVPEGHWAARSIAFVAEEHDWMRPAGNEFGPDLPLARRDLARAVVRAFAPAEQPDPARSFTDLPSTDPDFEFANVAVKLGWMVAPNNAFSPDAGAPKRVLARALVYALGLRQEVSALNNIATTDGTKLAHASDFGVLTIAAQLRLHYNHRTPNEAPELLPQTIVMRSDGAYALERAYKAMGTWLIPWVQRYRGIRVAAVAPERKPVLEFAFKYAGYPYVYAGEWYRKTSDSYCCGVQQQGGFDCSGFAWWMLRAPSNGWDNRRVRSYAGWALAERTSGAIAKAAPRRLEWEQVQPLDIVFFDTNASGEDWQAVDHVGVSLGNGWMIHSSGSRGGVTIEWIGDGWWRDRFLWARRITGTVSAQAR